MIRNKLISVLSDWQHSTTLGENLIRVFAYFSN